MVPNVLLKTQKTERALSSTPLQTGNKKIGYLPEIQIDNRVEESVGRNY